MRSSFASSNYNNAINNLTGMTPFSIVYRKALHHLLDLAKLSIGEKFSSASSAMAEQTIDVQKEVRTRLERFNARYKTAIDKRRREKVFEEGDMVMIYLRKAKFLLDCTTS